MYIFKFAGKNVSLLSDKIMWNVKSEKIRDLRYTLRETSLPRNL